VLVCDVNELKMVISSGNVFHLQNWKRMYDFIKIQPILFVDFMNKILRPF